VNTGITFGIILAGLPGYFAWRVWTSRGSGAASDLAKKKLAADERG
jgi:hypothetical protein